MNLAKLINDYGTAKYALGMHHERSHETCALPPRQEVEDSVRRLGEQLRDLLKATTPPPRPAPPKEPLANVPPTEAEWSLSWEPGNDWPDVVAEDWPILCPRPEVPGVQKERSLAECVANARLAAASQKLLAALRDLVALAVPGMNWTDNVGIQALSAARSAIKQAGE